MSPRPAGPGTAALTAAGCGTAIAAVCAIGVFHIEHLVGGLWSVAAILIAGTCCGLLARTLGRLCAVIPSGAGLLAYFSRGFGRRRALGLAGPYLVLCLILIGAEAVIVGLLVSRLAPLPPMLGALGFVVGTWALCRAGLRVGYRAQAVATWALVGCLGLLALVSLAQAGVRGDLMARLLPAIPSGARFAAAIGQALFLFMGFELVTSQVEVASPTSVGRALGASVVVLSTFYALVSLGFSCLERSPLGEAARFVPQLAIAEQTGSRAVVLGVVLLSLLASFTSVNGAMLALCRFVYALAAQRLLPRRFARIEPRSLMPRAALAALLGLAVGAIALVRWAGALESAIGAAAVTASLVYAALALVRDRPPFREPLGRGLSARLASHALALGFACLGVAVLVDAGAARRGTVLLLVAVYGLVSVLMLNKLGARDG